MTKQSPRVNGAGPLLLNPDQQPSSLLLKLLWRLFVWIYGLVALTVFEFQQIFYNRAFRALNDKDQAELLAGK